VAAFRILLLVLDGCVCLVCFVRCHLWGNDVRRINPTEVLFVAVMLSWEWQRPCTFQLWKWGVFFTCCYCDSRPLMISSALARVCDVCNGWSRVGRHVTRARQLGGKGRLGHVEPGICLCTSLCDLSFPLFWHCLLSPFVVGGISWAMHRSGVHGSHAVVSDLCLRGNDG